MKQLPQRDASIRFAGNMRHYHRSGSQGQRTWDEWVDGKSTSARSLHWFKILGFLTAILALGGIIAGLIIELR